MSQYFTTFDTWNGGFYELCMEFYPPSNQRLYEALQSVWNHPALDGCYSKCDKEPAEQTRIFPLENMIESGTHLYGLITLPNAIRVACGTVQVREAEGSDWLNFYIPLGALSTAYPVNAFPFVDENEVEAHKLWRRDIDDLLHEIGLSIFASIPFDLGLIGYECSGARYAKEVMHDGIPKLSGIGYLWSENSKLIYYPRTLNT